MARQAEAAVNSSALHVFEVLRLVGEAEEPLGVSEIGRRLSLPASTVYRALITLEDSDYIGRFQNTPRYELGPTAHLLNRALLHRFKLHARSRPLLRALAEETGETVSLTVRLGWYGLRLAGVYGSRDIYHRDRLGEVEVLHLSLQGRGILAFLKIDERSHYRRFLESNHRDLAPADWSSVEAQLDQARENAFVQERLSEGDRLVAVSLPVRGADGDVLASLTISGPVHDPESTIAASQWLRTRTALEAEIAGAPASFVSPFAAIPNDEILIRPDRA